MATSGTVKTGTLKHSHFYVTWQQSSQSTSGNYTDIKWQVGLNCGTSSNWDAWYNNAIKINSLKINGSTVISDTTYSNVSGAGDHQLTSGTARINHNTDGTKTFTISISGWLYTYGNTTGSDDFSLTKIPRYASISSFTVAQKDETSVTASWKADATIDYLWYSKDNGTNWTGYNTADGTSGSFTISGLSANTSYNFKLRVRRKDSQLNTDSSKVTQTTYDYPKPTAINDFVIGNGATVTLYNPLKRNITLDLISNVNNAVIGTYTGTATSINAEFKTADAINKQYASIPNANSGTYYARVTYGSVTKTLGTKTYSTNTANCSPTFTTFNVKDSNTTTVGVTGNNQVFVKGYSNVYVTIPSANKMTTKYSATAKSYAFSCDSLSKSANYSTSDVNVDMGTITNSGTLRVNVRAYDSRNNSALAYKDITVYDYSKPVINVSTKRLNDFENETTLKVSGSYTRLTIGGADKNRITKVQYRYRETNGTWSGWTVLNTTLSAGKFTCSDIILSLDNSKSFEFQMQAMDLLSNNTVTAKVDIGQALFFICSNGKQSYMNTDFNINGVSKSNGYPSLNNVKQFDTGTHDFNNYTTSGVYCFGTGCTLQNKPNEPANGYLMVLTYGNNTNFIKQIFYRLGTANTNDGNTYVRSRISGTWSVWSNPAYPIGSTYICDSNTNPSGKFGGTWSLVRKNVIDTGWQNFSWTNSTYIGTSQSSYTSNKWRIKDNVLYIAVGVGATATINTSTEYEISRIPIKGNTSYDSTYERIWNGAVGGSGALAGFMVLQNADYMSVYLKPHTTANNHSAPWFSTHFAIPMDNNFTFASGSYATEYIWKRTA